MSSWTGYSLGFQGTEVYFPVKNLVQHLYNSHRTLFTEQRASRTELSQEQGQIVPKKAHIEACFHNMTGKT